MAVTDLETPISSDKLLKEVERLSVSEIADFSQRVLSLQAQRRAPNLSRDEAELLRKINESRPLEFQKHYNQLHRKRRAGTLTPAENEELIRMIDEAEAYDVRRMGALMELAQLRQKSLRDLMIDLGMKPPKYA